MRRTFAFVLSVALGLFTLLGLPRASWAYPFWAQQVAPDTPREATGKLVCANCHLAQKNTQLEVPHSVFPDTVFKAAVKIPYQAGLEEIGADGSKVPLQVGAVVVLPDGYTLAPEDRIPETIREETEGVYYTPYNDTSPNVILVGPLPGDRNQEIVFPVLSPDPDRDSSVIFGKSLIFAGGNRGRGQLYPTGERSNNGVFTASAAGRISTITTNDDGSRSVAIATDDGSVEDLVPVGVELIVSPGESVSAGTALSSDPNVGGFGQTDSEIVLQSPARILGMLGFFTLAIAAQILLVLKKRQVERVQAVEGI